MSVSKSKVHIKVVDGKWQVFPQGSSVGMVYFAIGYCRRMNYKRYRKIG